ncbi:hypothetical protein NC652_013507 [Populus alba x Populus x berolinensis]|uniref:Uncharacterized protein n=1 Tax=Populus alba x Populus x berolinensis TaxID=444605 RepID=A0AAD6QV11_9ROSI|nr:hypothetical protein NC652_013507 [Populus alba x Populus x berolinensis]KAJ6996877.1 hypothetical protein NC653_013461 [Populus alba x Populus x berolinensis]
MADQSKKKEKEKENPSRSISSPQAFLIHLICGLDCRECNCHTLFAATFELIRNNAQYYPTSDLSAFFVIFTTDVLSTVLCFPVATTMLCVFSCFRCFLYLPSYTLPFFTVKSQ